MSGIGDILKTHGFKFNKRYGQNFITDTNLLRAIVSDSGAAGGDVVEVGAGAGTLTRELSLVCRSVTAYEIDLSLRPVLNETLSNCGNVIVVFADIMDVPTNQIDEMFAKGYHVVANLPYYITTPVIFKFLEQSKNVLSLTVMVQKEVAHRFTAAPSTPDYSALTVAAEFAGRARITRIVPRSVFYPVPNVDSAVVKIDIDRRRYNVAEPLLVRKLYRAAFAMRRKTLLNNLGTVFGDKERLKGVVTALGYGADVRGEILSAADFAQLAVRIRDAGLDI